MFFAADVLALTRGSATTLSRGGSPASHRPLSRSSDKSSSSNSNRNNTITHKGAVVASSTPQGLGATGTRNTQSNNRSSNKHTGGSSAGTSKKSLSSKPQWGTVTAGGVVVHCDRAHAATTISAKKRKGGNCGGRDGRRALAAEEALVLARNGQVLRCLVWYGVVC